MKKHLFFILFSIAATCATAQSGGTEYTEWFTDAGQITAGAGTNASALVDGDPSTVWTSDGSSLTIKLPDGLNVMDGRPFRMSFTIPAGSDNYPTGFAIYGSHNNNGNLEGENPMGWTTSRVELDGSVEYTTPLLYVRGGFNNEWWYCTHLRFECTETAGQGETSNFELSGLRFYESKEYTFGYGSVLENNGDIINAGDQDQGKDWYRPLVDENPSTVWNANEKGSWVWQNRAIKGTGLILKMPSVDAATDYTLKITAPQNSGDYGAFPTKMKWMYRTNGGTWTDGGTIELSDVAAGQTYESTFTVLPEYQQLAFVTEANRSGEKIDDWAGGYPNTRLAGFQFYGEKKSYLPTVIPDPLPGLGTQYPNPNKWELNQEYFKTKLYSQSLKGFRYIHTHGIVDKDFDNNFNADGGWITNKDIWNADGTLSEGFKVPGADLGVELPNFSYEAPVNNSNILPPGEDRKRQPTTTIIHEVYAIPGERVDLIPYSDIYTTSSYFEDFYRFYDYRTAKAHKDVYFLFNPRAAAYNDFGIFGGRGLGYVFDDRDYGSFAWPSDMTKGHRGAGGFASFYRPATEDGLIDEYIAGDFSQHYYVDGQLESENRQKDVRRFINKDEKTIHAPIINFRHVFHVVDGRTLAEDMSADREANRNYVARNRRRISARANNQLAIRLINPMPSEEGVKANFYYKKRDGGYTRMGKYDIETYRYEDGKTIGGNIEDMFTPFENSAYYAPDIDCETELNPPGTNNPAWLRPNIKFYRAIACEAEHAKEGKYLIRLIAKRPNGERILLEDGEPLILREIVVEFLGEEHASFRLESENIRQTHTEEYLDANFQSKTVVDFDKYMALSGTEFMHAEGDGERIKYPAPWMHSSYAFGYKYKQDWGTYTIASHADCVPYSQAAKTAADRHDRLWSNTGGKQHGFFYYANAAGDPGEMAKINIPNLCVGSTLHVSAWVNSMGLQTKWVDDHNEPDVTITETANVLFNLIAVMKDGREVSINSFTTGYVPRDEEHCGKWMHVYYAVTPDFSEIDGGHFNVKDVEQFQVMLENNSLNSNGADYAIDDIRIYVAKPVVMDTQIRPVCNGEKETMQRMDIPLRPLLNSLGIEIPGENDEGQEVSIHYTVFDKERFETLVESEGGYTQAVFEGAALKYVYNNELSQWGMLTFNTKRASNPEWTKDLAPNVAGNYVNDGQECISFTIKPRDESLRPGKMYIAALCIPGNGEEPLWTDFDITDICTKQSEFVVKGSNVIKVDGVVRTDNADLSVCENQFPTIQLDIIGIEAETGETQIVDSNPLTDWYMGTLEEFNSEEWEGISLAEALLNFRQVYPDALTTVQEYAANGEFVYNREYRSIIDHYADTRRLIVGSYSYVSEAIRFEEGQDEVKCPVTAIPANREIELTIDGREYIVCNEPAEVVITVDKRAPGLLDGFAGTDYPEDMQDVPIRLGLEQMKSEMYVPLRDIYIVTPNVHELTKAPDTGIYVVRTNDPAYRSLSDDGEASELSGLREVGEVLEIVTSETDKRGQALVKLDNINLKEGYYYTMRFNYMEKPTGGLKPENVCDGQTIFTIKVVAEYQMWTGAVDGSLNFNNDGNWRRVTRAELLDDSSVSPYKVVDGSEQGSEVNPNEYSFSPLGFTKVIIPPGATYPHLFQVGKSAPVNVFDGKEHFNYSHATGLADDAVAGLPTKDIEFDLTVAEIDNKLYCRPWYANKCEQIHFLSNAEIMNQQHLVYEKAWADVEMEPGRWYTASSPLQSVVAGDMYLPTDGARQETPLFADINFDKNLHDRFAPAVYQRGWDKGVANVYELPAESDAEVTNVAVALDWSNVYNDVQESYSAGKGFSVKTDVTDAVNANADFVKFRLPKADASYHYWTQDGNSHGPENGTAVGRDSTHRLNAVDAVVTITNRNSGKYFLAGNPFMAHIDMKKFLDANKGVIGGKYWIMNGESQQCAVMDSGSDGFIGTVDNAAALPPFQGFFVEALEACTEISLTYSADMLTTVAKEAGEGPELHQLSRGGAGGAQLLITASDADTPQNQSQAMLRVAATANRGYERSEDALMLAGRDSRTPQVFTLAGNKAVSINSTDNAEGVEVGLLAGDDALTVLRFDNVADFGTLALHDRREGTYTALYDGMEYMLEGKAAGRLFLVTPAEMPGDAALQMAVVVKDRCVVARTGRPDSEIDLFIYDLSGHAIASLTGCEGEARVSDLDQGFYIVVAKSGDGAETRRKIMIK